MKSLDDLERKKSSDLETSSEKNQIGEESPCTEATRENEQTFFVETYIRKKLELENYSIVSTLGNRFFFQLPACYLNDQNPWCTTLLLAWTNSIVPTLGSVKTGLGGFFGSKVTPIFCL